MIWTVYDDENNVIGTVTAENRFDAQDQAQLISGNSWIEPETENNRIQREA